jgi:hypothetical protein
MAKGSFILPLLPEEIDFEVNSVVEGQVLNTAPTGVILLDTDLNPIVPVSITQLTNQFEIIIATGSIVPSSIEINGVFFKSVNPGDTLNIDIENSLSVAVGTPDSINNRVDISDATLVIEKSDFTTIATINIAAEDLDYYQVADSVIENSDASYTANVKATDPLTLPDQTIKVNTVTEGAISSVGTIDINITDGVNPVVPNSVGIVGRTVTVEVPSGGGSFDLDLVDRFGNAFPTKQVTANATWDLRTLTPFDWADLFLSRESSWGVSGFYTDSDAVTAVTNLVDDLFSAGLWELMYGVYPLVGGTAAKHKWNLRYPFNSQNSNILNFSGSPTHNREGISVVNAGNYPCFLSENPSGLEVNGFGHFSSYYRAYTGVNNNRDLISSGDSRSITWVLNDPSAGSGTLIMAWCSSAYQVNPSPALTLTGHWTLNRPNSTNIRQIRNGTLERNVAGNNSTGVFFDGTVPYGPFRWGRGTKTMSSFTLGKGLTPTQEADLYTAIQTFQTTLGRQL